VNAVLPETGEPAVSAVPRPRRRRIDLAGLGYAAGWRVVRALPDSVGLPAFRFAADRAWRRQGRGVRQLAANLRRVVGPAMPADEFDDLVRRAMRSYARYYLEAFRLPARSKAEVLAGFVVYTGLDRLRVDMDSGRGAIIALPHAGNWDAAGAWVAATGWPIVTVAERLRPESLYRRFVAYRERLGMEILPLTGGDSSTRATLEDRLGRGYLVPLLADRDLPGRGVDVDFFGACTTMPPGPAMLALRTGAPLYVLDLWFEPELLGGHLHGPLPVPGREVGPFGTRVRLLTQAMADGLAGGIAAHPEDWHMLARLWADLGPVPGREDDPGADLPGQGG
jgi:KDO2-lipid IV(A) lauroyltransferase